MTYKNCPKCHLALEGKGISCAECGWSARKDRAKQDNENGLGPWPSNCEYRAGDLRCQYPAVFSPSTQGGGQYLCKFHMRGQRGMVDDLICKQSQRYTPEGREADDKAFEAEVEASLKRLGLEQRPGEPKQEWISRMRTYCLETTRAMAHKNQNKDWAKKIIARHQAGEQLWINALDTAKQALMNAPEELEPEPGCNSE